MLNILTIGDPHFKINNVKQTTAMTKAVLQYVDEMKPDFVVVLGDILDKHENIHVSPLSQAVDFIFALQNRVKTFVLIGNHDLKNNSQFLSNEHPFTGLKPWLNTVIVDTVIHYKIDNRLFTFLPYVPPGRFEEALNTSEINWRESAIIFAHQEFKGCKMGGKISLDGDEWKLDHPLVVSGHIHEFQMPQPNIVYVGTPIQHNYGDGINKIILMCHCPVIQDQSQIINKVTFTKIDLQLPKKRIDKISTTDMDNYEPKIGDDIKIQIHGTTSEIKNAISHYKIKQWEKAGYKISTKVENDIDKNVKKFLHRPKYSTYFYSQIKDDPELKEAYEEVFGKVI